MMNAEQIGDVLAKAAAFDQRTTGEADILAWMEAVGDVSFDDALAAVTRHYRDSTEFLRPAHLLDQVRAIRNERAAQRHSEALARPSRFEADQIRDERVRAGVRKLSEMLAVPAANAADDPLARARARGRRERRAAGRAEPMPRTRRQSKPIDLTKVPGPAWADDTARERESVAALHTANRPCGRTHCTRPACHTPEES